MEFNVRHAEFETLNGRPEFKKKKKCDNQLDLQTWKAEKDLDWKS